MNKLRYDFIIVGNGAIGCAIASKIKLEKLGKVAIIGPSQRNEAASLAAGAMLNLFAELDKDSLATEIDRKKFLISKHSKNLWFDFLPELAFDLNAPKVAKGTYLINNASTNETDDLNFNAIKNFMDEYSEPYNEVDPKNIQGLSPQPHARALRALELREENSISSKDLFNFYDKIFRKSDKIDVIDSKCESLRIEDSGLKTVCLLDGKQLQAKNVVLASGVNCQQYVDQLNLSSRIPRIFYGIGTSLIIKSDIKFAEKVIRTPNRGLACGVYLVPYREGYFYLGATNYVCPWELKEPRVSSLHSLLSAGMEQINRNLYKSTVYKIINGYRPTSADTYPLLGELRSAEGVYLLSGTKRDGFHLSPAIAEEFIRSVNTGKQMFEGYFSPERKLILHEGKENFKRLAVEHLISGGYQHELKLPKMNWDRHIDSGIASFVEDAYLKSSVTGDYGIPPELLDMYRYGHVERNLEFWNK